MRLVELLLTNNGSTTLGQQFTKFLQVSSTLTNVEPHLINNDNLLIL